MAKNDAEQGRAVRVRTVRLSATRYAHIYEVRGPKKPKTKGAKR